MPREILIRLFGVGAMISLFMIYQQEDRKKMLLCKLSADVFWVAHYGLLGAVGGMIPNFVGIFRELIFVNRGRRRWADHPIWPFVFIGISCGILALTYDSALDILPVAASAFVTLSLWVKNPTLTKIISFPVSSAFLVYDIFVGSLIGAVNESLSLLSIVIFAIKKIREKTPAYKRKEDKQ